MDDVYNEIVDKAYEKEINIRKTKSWELLKDIAILQRTIADLSQDKINLKSDKDTLDSLLDEKDINIEYLKNEMKKLANVVANFNKDCKRFKKENQKLKHIIEGCQSTFKTNAFRFKTYEEKLIKKDNEIEKLKVCGNCKNQYTALDDSDQCDLFEDCSRVYDDRIDDYWRPIK